MVNRCFVNVAALDCFAQLKISIRFIGGQGSRYAMLPAVLECVPVHVQPDLCNVPSVVAESARSEAKVAQEWRRFRITFASLRTKLDFMCHNEVRDLESRNPLFDNLQAVTAPAEFLCPGEQPFVAVRRAAISFGQVSEREY